jgi:hypothetical protein
MSETSRIRVARKSTERIADQISSLIEMASDEGLLALAAPSISSWSVGEQVEHLRRSDLTILNALTSLPSDAPREGSPSLVGRLVLSLGFIPRGKGRAPKATEPLDFDVAGLPEKLVDVRLGFAQLEPELERLGRSTATIRHPALGYFNPSQMLAFTAIHHHHHMKIAADIQRASAGKR